MTDVFISYAREQRHLVEPLAAALEAQGYEVWWDSRLTAGQLFDDEILKQIEAAKALVVIWSPESSVSRYVLMEVGIAHAWSKKLIPLRLSDFRESQIPEPFKKHQAVELVDAEAIAKSLKNSKVNPPDTLEQALRKLDRNAPDARRELESWIAKYPGFYLKGHEGKLSITVRSAVGPAATDVNFGTIWTDDDTLYFGDFCGQLIARINGEAAWRYIESLAALVEAAYVTSNNEGQPTNIRMPGQPSYPKVRTILSKGEAWGRLLLDAKEHLGPGSAGS